MWSREKFLSRSMVLRGMLQLFAHSSMEKIPGSFKSQSRASTSSCSLIHWLQHLRAEVESGKASKPRNSSDSIMILLLRVPSLHIYNLPLQAIFLVQILQISKTTYAKSYWLIVNCEHNLGNPRLYLFLHHHIQVTIPEAKCYTQPSS